MESRRQLKVSSLLQRELADIFTKEDRLKFRGFFITVTTVRVTPDLKTAKVFLSIFPGTGSAAVMSDIDRRTGEVRGILGTRLRHSLKSIPELYFRLDDSLDYAERIDELLK